MSNAFKISWFIHENQKKIFELHAKKTGLTVDEIKSKIEDVNPGRDFLSIIDADSGLRLDYKICDNGWSYRESVVFGYSFLDKIPGIVINPDVIISLDSYHVPLLPKTRIEDFFLSLAVAGVADLIVQRFTEEVEAELAANNVVYLNRLNEIPEDAQFSIEKRESSSESLFKNTLASLKNPHDVLGIKLTSASCKWHIFRHELVDIGIRIESFIKPRLL